MHYTVTGGDIRFSRKFLQKHDDLNSIKKEDGELSSFFYDSIVGTVR